MNGACFVARFLRFAKAGFVHQGVVASDDLFELLRASLRFANDALTFLRRRSLLGAKLIAFVLFDLATLSFLDGRDNLVAKLRSNLRL